MSTARHSAHSSFNRITRLGVIAAAVSGLAVLGACAEGGLASKVAGVESPVGDITVDAGAPLAGHIIVCLSGVITPATATSDFVAGTDVGVANSETSVNLAAGNLCQSVLTLNADADVGLRSTHVTLNVPAGYYITATDCVQNHADMVLFGCGPGSTDNLVTLSASEFHGSQVTFFIHPLALPCDRISFGGQVGDFTYGGNVGIKDGTVSGNLTLKNNETGEDYLVHSPTTYLVGDGSGGVERIIIGLDEHGREIVFSITDILEPAEAEDIVTIKIDGHLVVDAVTDEGGNLQLHGCKDE